MYTIKKTFFWYMHKTFVYSGYFLKLHMKIKTYFLKITIR